MRHWILIFILLSVPNILLPQIFSAPDFGKLDELLLTGQYSEVNAFLDQKNADAEKYLSGPEDSSRYHLVGQQYRDLSRFFEKLDTLSQGEIESQAEAFLKRQASFTVAKAGIKGAEMFSQFRELFRQGEKRKALKFYYLSYLHKSVYLYDLNRIYSLKIRQIENYISENKYDMARAEIDNIESDGTHFSIRREYRDKLMRLKKIVSGKLAEKNAYLMQIRQTGPVRKSFSVSLGSAVLIYGTPVRQDQYLQFIDPFNAIQYRYYLDEVNTDIGLGFTADFAKYFQQKYKIGIGVVYAGGRYTGISKSYSWKSTINLRHIAGQIDFNYLFRKNSGMRPYSGIGLRQLFVTRKNLQTANILSSANARVSAEEKFNLTQLLFNFGMEYIASPEAGWIIGWYTTLYYNLNDSKYVGKAGAWMGLKLGILL